jgi:hypothetical protein
MLVRERSAFNVHERERQTQLFDDAYSDAPCNRWAW